MMDLFIFFSYGVNLFINRPNNNDDYNNVVLDMYGSPFPSHKGKLYCLL